MKYFLSVILCFLIWACQDVKRPEIPEDLISEEQMVEILTEVYLVNAARSFDNRTIIENKMKLDSFIYKKFNIDSLQFVKSNAYYTSNLDVYNRLFVAVEDRMSKIKIEVDSLMLKRVKELEAKRIQDSIDGVIDTSKKQIKEKVNDKPKLIDSRSSDTN